MRVRVLVPIQAGIDVALSEDTCHKINAIAAFSNLALGQYSVNLLPPSATWSNTGYGLNDHSNLLCVDNRPITFWTLCEIWAATFYRGNILQPRAAVRGLSILETDMDKASHIAKQFENPVQSAFFAAFLEQYLTHR